MSGTVSVAGLHKLELNIRKISKLNAQGFHQKAQGFFITAVPSPLALFHRLNQTRPGENRHVVRNGGL